MAAWVKISTDRNTFTTFYSVDDGNSSGADSLLAQTLVDGTSSLAVVDNGVASSGTFAHTVGVWYYVALCATGTTGNYYIRANGSTTWTTLTWTGGTTTTCANH